MAKFEDIIVLKDKVSESLKRINANFKHVQESASNTQKKLAGLQARMKSFGATTRKVAGTMKNFALGATALVGGTIAIANKVADAGDRIDKMSQKIGMSRKSFQEWDYIMSQNGGSVESLQMGFKTLTTQIEGVQKGSKDSINAFRSLGVSVKDNKGQFRSQEDVFNDTIRALQKIKDPTKKAMLANRLFGRSAADLKPLLNQDADAIDNLREKANQMGMILTDEQIDNSVKFKDTLDTTTRIFQAKFGAEIMRVMPYLTKTLEWTASTGLPAIITAGGAVVKFFGEVGSFLGNIIGQILSIPTYISWGIEMAQMKIKGLIFEITQLINNLIEKIMGIAKAIGGGVKGLVGGIASTVKNIASTTNNNQSYSTVNNNTTNNYNYSSPAGGFSSPNRVPLNP